MHNSETPTSHGTTIERQNRLIERYELPISEINYCKHTTIDGLLCLIEGVAMQNKEIKQRMEALEKSIGENEK